MRGKQARDVVALGWLVCGIFESLIQKCIFFFFHRLYKVASYFDIAQTGTFLCTTYPYTGKRAAQVSIMSSSLEKEFYIKANKAGWKKHEPERVKNLEEPLLFKQLVYRAVNEEGVSIQRGAELLQMPYSDVEKYCGLVEVWT